MLVSKKLEFDMGHRVPNHKSKCRNLHGHRYAVEIIMQGDVVGEAGVSDEGMVIDFSDIKRIGNEFIDTYLDHGYMGHKVLDRELLDLAIKSGWKVIEVDFVPTAENIAKWLFEQLAPKYQDIYGTNLHLSAIQLYETPTSCVVYSPDNE